MPGAQQPAAARAAVPLETAAASSTIPLVVDLDGTLVHTDTTFESVLALLRQPLRLLHTLAALRQGRASFKQRLAATAHLAADNFAYNQELLAYLRRERARGRNVILATGADRSTAEAVAQYLGLFDRVIASDGRTNMTGTAKLAAIRAVLGGAPFTYIGNSRADLRVWCEAHGAICVNTRAKVARAAAQLAPVEFSLAAAPLLRSLMLTIRPHLWAINLLVFVPLLAAGAVADLPAWIAAATAFVAFCCTASGMYVLAALADLHGDRRHPNRALRPLAAGAVPLHVALFTGLGLILLGLGLGATVGAAPALLCYIVLSAVYWLWLKPYPAIAIIVIAELWALRLFCGSAATGEALRPRLIAVCGITLLAIAAATRVPRLTKFFRRRSAASDQEIRPS
jgi:hypothetical protein